MEFLVIVAVLLSFTGCHAKIKDSSSPMPLALSYWNNKLPTTPIPTLLLAHLSSLEPNSPSYFKQTSTLIQPLTKIIYTHITYTRNTATSNSTKPKVTVSAEPMFFLQKTLSIGTKFTTDMVFWKSTETLYFLPVVVANKIPFSTKSLSASLKTLHITPNSEMGLTMKETLEVCESSAMTGESKKCLTSLESMIDYTTSQIGTNDLNVFVTNVSKTKSGLQQYSLASISFESKPTSRFVACHPIGYPYLVYFCHQIKDTRMFQLSFKSDEGNIAEMVAVCHEDTSEWNPEHVSFKMLHVKPGGEAICHFMTEDEILWIAAN
ncbi:BURP domain protein RD22-like [Cryptomeria japonica]|uniref:BURP domain protein RD22-like n=1 Tax=Cryptomeria japonica TaxID=3369 RepID=UPI0027DA6F7E|nr:BURP domain protein RD22-like [Cryptomeria japonica]